MSGRINMAKPDREIFEHMIGVYDLDPRRTVFIDDTAPNIDTAQQLGFATVHFASTVATRQALVRLGVLSA